MTRISASTFASRTHHYLQLAQDAPVIIESDGKPCAVVVGYEWDPLWHQEVQQVTEMVRKEKANG